MVPCWSLFSHQDVWPSEALWQNWNVVCPIWKKMPSLYRLQPCVMNTSCLSLWSMTSALNLGDGVCLEPHLPRFLLRSQAPACFVPYFKSREAYIWISTNMRCLNMPSLSIVYYVNIHISRLIYVAWYLSLRRLLTREAFVFLFFFFLKIWYYDKHYYLWNIWHLFLCAAAALVHI